jgi:large subunit ribosomal protein L20
MPRVKRGTTAHKRRKNVLKEAKGFRWGRSTKFKAAKQALMKAWSYSYRDRKVKKRTMRRLWNISINTACRENGIVYRDFIFKLREKNIKLNRKVLSEIANNRPETFVKILNAVKETEK